MNFKNNLFLFALTILLIFIDGNDASQSIPTSCRTSYRTACVNEHNKYRTIHKAPPIVTNATIENVATKYAQYLADFNLFQHSQTSGLGENLAYIWTTRNVNLTDCSSFAQQIVAMWYNEYMYYSYSFPGFGMSTGHFTQLVWKSTTTIGCGLAIINTKVYGVTNYFPPGNYIGTTNFVKNVLPST